MTLHDPENWTSLCVCVKIPEGELVREPVIRYARANARLHVRARSEEG